MKAKLPEQRQNKEEEAEEDLSQPQRALWTHPSVHTRVIPDLGKGAGGKGTRRQSVEVEQSVPVALSEALRGQCALCSRTVGLWVWKY